MLRTDTVLVNLLHKGHDELALFHDGVLLSVAVHHIHGVQTVLSARAEVEHRADIIAHRFDQRRELTLRIADQNIVFGVQHEEGNKLLGGKGFAGAGNAQKERGLIEKICLVAHDKVVAYGVLPKVDASRILNLLHLERDKHRKALGGQGAEGIDPACAYGKDGVQTVELLILQHSKLAHVLSRNGKHRFGVAVELLFAFCGEHHRNDTEHHALIACGEIVQKLLCLLALKLHIIGNDG